MITPAILTRRGAAIELILSGRITRALN